MKSEIVKVIGICSICGGKVVDNFNKSVTCRSCGATKQERQLPVINMKQYVGWVNCDSAYHLYVG